MTIQLVPSPIETISLTSYVVHEDPKVSLIPEFLSPDECNHLINMGESLEFRPSLVGRGAYAHDSLDKSERFENVPSINRTSLSVILKPSHDSVVALVEAKLVGLVGLPLSQLESMVLVKYEPGQVFKEHHDGIFRPFTVFIYLNDLPSDAGGETRFPAIGLRIKPRAGTAVLWRNSHLDVNGSIIEDHRLVHEGLPPRNCIKYGVNCFFNYNQMR
jgi:prolyl 4-hydroxylase